MVSDELPLTASNFTRLAVSGQVSVHQDSRSVGVARIVSSQRQVGSGYSSYETGR